MRLEIYHDGKRWLAALLNRDDLQLAAETAPTFEQLIQRCQEKRLVDAVTGDGEAVMAAVNSHPSGPIMPAEEVPE